MRKLELPKAAPSTARKENAASAKPKSVLESFECIVELAEDSALAPEFFEKAQAHIRYAARKLRLSPMQTVLLAMMVDRSESSSIRISEIADYSGCRTTRILRLSDDIDALEARRYIRASRSRNSLSYRVPADVLKSLRKNEPYTYTAEPVTDLSTFFDTFSTLMDEKDDDELTYDALKSETLGLLAQISQSHFHRCLRRLGMDDDYNLLFIFMAHLFVENNDDRIGFHDIDNLYDDDKIPGWIKSGFRARSSELFGNRLIENTFSDGMAESDCFKLTDYAKEELLGELGLSRIGRSDKDLIKPGTLAARQLIYNPQEARQIDELSAILDGPRFARVQQRLEKAGMRKGFCCLFYGSPGTGKTETVYQIARRTGRAILRVDVDKIKSCWVGESEKNIKALFDRYRNLCKNATLAPILLFNEADAVLGVRMEGANRAVDKMENSLQNIILQEMESLEGIMIATTNLTTNLDKAFERRFLYKIQFHRPSPAARAAIWQAMMPGLSPESAAALAAKYDLSGGEIENIVRKQSVNAILSGSETADPAALAALCAHERLTAPHRIGFTTPL